MPKLPTAAEQGQGSVRVTRQQISVSLTWLERDPANLLKVGVTLRAVVDKAAFLFQCHEERIAVNLLLPRPVGSNGLRQTTTW